MAIQGGIAVGHQAVFPNGAFAVGEVTAVEDFDAAQAARESGKAADTQSRDKTTGMRLWAVRVIDADEMTRKGQAEVSVKIAADVQPVPPEALPGLPFRPVEFDNLVAVPYIDSNRSRPRIAWSFRASGMHAPAKGLRSAGTGAGGDGKAA